MRRIRGPAKIFCSAITLFRLDLQLHAALHLQV
jgi:hypothetical protein